jgi:hypothetical protein
MSLLTVVQQFCQRTGLTSPPDVMGSTDDQVLQIKALLEEEGNDCALRGAWQCLEREAAHTTVATESQGLITTIADDGFRWIKNQTIWDRSRNLPICGPLNDQEWQAMKALVPTGPRYLFRIRQDQLLVNPVPPAGLAWYFEYQSQNWIVDSGGTIYKSTFTQNGDETCIPESLLLMGLRWRWKKEKGFDYAEDFRTYEMQLKDALGRDGGKPVVYADNTGYRGPRPGVFVPAGSWMGP